MNKSVHPVKKKIKQHESRQKYGDTLVRKLQTQARTVGANQDFPEPVGNYRRAVNRQHQITQILDKPLSKKHRFPFWKKVLERQNCGDHKDFEKAHSLFIDCSSTLQILHPLILLMRTQGEVLGF